MISQNWLLKSVKMMFHLHLSRSGFYVFFFPGPYFLYPERVDKSATTNGNQLTRPTSTVPFSIFCFLLNRISYTKQWKMKEKTKIPISYKCKPFLISGHPKFSVNLTKYFIPIIPTSSSCQTLTPKNSSLACSPSTTSKPFHTLPHHLHPVTPPPSPTSAGHHDRLFWALTAPHRAVGDAISLRAVGSGRRQSLS